MPVQPLRTVGLGLALMLLGHLLSASGVIAAASPQPTVPAPVGSVRDLRPFNPDQIPIELPVAVKTGGPPFLMSDNPEQIKTPGVHTVATFHGKARFFWFITNYTPPSQGPLYVTLVAENRGEQPAQLRVDRLGYKISGTDSELAGQEALYQYLACAPSPPTSPRPPSPSSPSPSLAAATPPTQAAVRPPILIPPGGRTFVLPELNRQRLYKGWVIVLYLEVETDQPVTFYVEAVHQPTLEVDALTRLQPDESEEGSGALIIRGTFPASEREMHFVINQLPARLLIAADLFHPKASYYDPYLLGTDEMTGRQTLNTGNYGVIYRLRITINVPTERPLGVYFSPVPTSGLATAARVLAPYLSLERLPRLKGTRVLSPTDGVLVAVIPPTVPSPTHPDAPGSADPSLTFSPTELVLETCPPAGSCAIVPVLIAPLPDD